MRVESLARVEAAFDKYFGDQEELQKQLNINDIQLRFICGLEIRREVKECKSVKVSKHYGACMAMVEKKFGVTRGDKWWRVCYETAVKLTDEDRELLKNENTTATQLQWLVQKTKPQVELLLEGLREGENIWPAQMKTKKYKQDSVKTKKEHRLNPHVSSSDPGEAALKQGVLLPEKWSEDDIINKLTHYINRFSHIPNKERLSVLNEVIARTGVRAG